MSASPAHLAAALAPAGARGGADRSRSAGLGVAALLAGCLALEVVGPARGAGASLLVVPVALHAVASGLRGGLAAAGLAWVASVGADLLRPDGVASMGTHLWLGVVLVAIGGGVGHAVERLRTRSALLEAVLGMQEELGEGMAVSEPERSRLVHVNPALARLLGREPGALAGEPVASLAHPADRARFVERIRLRLAGHPLPKRADVVLLGATGTTIEAETTSARARLGGRDHVLTIVRDASEARRAARSVQAEHELSAAVLATAVCPVIVLDRESHVVRANPAAERLVGRPQAELVGGTPWELGLVAEEHRGTVAAAFGGLLAGHHQAEHVSDWIRPDGTRRMVSWVVTAIRDEDGSPLYGVGVGADLTEQRAAERAERRARASLELRTVELERSNADLSHFASIASHDLREPLRAVSGFAELLRERAAASLDARSRSHLEAIEVAARRMESLLDGLRTYGAIGRDPAVTTDVDLDVALERVLTGVSEELAERAGEIRHAPLPTVAGNAAQLEQVLQNLVSNALKYADAAPPRLDIGARRRGTAWQVTVADNGIGVPVSHRTRIFEMFRRLHADDAIPGTGVGLAVCQRIVRRHGGEIWVEESPGGGSAFSFTLPDPEGVA